MDMVSEQLKHVEELIRQQIQRAEEIEKDSGKTDFLTKEKITIGFIDGDGIGPIITDSAQAVLSHLLKDDLENGKVEFKRITGLNIENRIKQNKTVPDDVLDQVLECDVLLKGPTTTPSKNDGMPNIESANVYLRRRLDLFANVRPVKIPELGIDWTFFRENTEGEYPLGSQGIDIGNNISMDFKVTTDAGSKRIARAAFEYAKNMGNQQVSIITKANIIKKSDGRFLENCLEVAKEYPDVPVDDWFVDIIAANLINPNRQRQFNVFVLPNLYGDIITDEAAQLQGGVGTAGSANIGDHYAMFEAIHGSATRMVERGDAKYANPSSLLSASVMLLRHIGRTEMAAKLDTAVAKANEKLNMSGSGQRNTAEEFTNHVLSLL